MLGHAVLRLLATSPGHEVLGSCRAHAPPAGVEKVARQQWLPGVDVEHHDSLVAAFARARPELVVNCIGLVKQLSQSKDPLAAVPVNALLPHRLAGLCAATGARLVHISTDCVFSGARGNYRESDFPEFAALNHQLEGFLATGISDPLGAAIDTLRDEYQFG